METASSLTRTICSISFRSCARCGIWGSERAESTVAKVLSPAVQYTQGSVQSSEGDRREGQTVSILSPYSGKASVSPWGTGRQATANSQDSLRVQTFRRLTHWYRALAGYLSSFNAHYRMGFVTCRIIWQPEDSKNTWTQDVTQSSNVLWIYRLRVLVPWAFHKSSLTFMD